MKNSVGDHFSIWFPHPIWGLPNQCKNCIFARFECESRSFCFLSVVDAAGGISWLWLTYVSLLNSKQAMMDQHMHHSTHSQPQPNPYVSLARFPNRHECLSSRKWVGESDISFTFQRQASYDGSTSAKISEASSDLHAFVTFSFLKLWTDIRQKGPNKTSTDVAPKPRRSIKSSYKHL